MQPQAFEELSARQQLALLIAMHVRNEIEGFHAEYLSDAQMKELNPLIRQAIYDALAVLEPPEADRDLEQWGMTFSWLIRMIPDYWEVPDKPSDRLFRR